jgi:hypothetical protein
MTQSAAVVSLTGNSISSIAPEPQPKDLATLEDELRILEAELKSNQQLINERASRSYQVQSAQTGVLLGSKSRMDLEAAQKALEESVNAISRKHLLEQAIADQRAIIQDYQHRERAQFVADLKRQFIDVMDRYKIESKKLFAIHEELVSLDKRYRALAPAYDGLLAPYFRELNLPAVTGSLASRSGFCTGQD